MKGAYKISVSNSRVKYEFTVKRNITIIQGDSATGKTTLIKLIDTYYNVGKNSGIKLDCSKECIVLRGRDWERQLEDISDSIVFIDEGNRFVASEDFARAARNSDNYYVIITREDLKCLPYSVNEIYGVQKKGKTVQGQPTYNGMYRLYGELSLQKKINPTLVITEDSNAGFDFFSGVCEGIETRCISANGKSRMIEKIYPRPEERILLIADGAAYGSEMNETMRYMEQYHNYALYLPESFEWLILKSGILKSKELEGILNNPEQYIESKEYFSWERFFTCFLEKITEESNLVSKYNKNGKLDEFYKNKGNREKILNQIEKIDL